MPPEPIKLSVSTDGTIGLPEGMDIETTIRHLRHIHSLTEGSESKSELIPVMPAEGAYALRLALIRVFGDAWIEGNSQFRLQISPTETVDVPWGAFSVPGFEGYFETGIGRDDHGHLCFQLEAEFKRKDAPKFEEVITQLKAILATNGLYKGKAFRISFRNPDGSHVEFLKPEMLDVTEAFMPIYNAKTLRRINGEILSVVKQPTRMAQMGVSLKRGILVAGEPGTGKTLLALYIANVATLAGWTFIYLTDARDFEYGYDLAKSYEPAILFVEDINRVVGPRRDSSVDMILNTIDGIDSKTAQVLTIMTTNDVDQINAAMLRAGRTDSKILLTAYDEEAGLKALEYYTQGRLAPKCNLSKLATHVVGMTGAQVKALVDRALIYAISRTEGEETVLLTQQDILDAVESLKEEAGGIESQNDISQYGEMVMLIPAPSGFGEMFSNFSPNGSKKKKVVH